ncbi:MAG: ABC transporter permease [Clostridiales Family XIII bacterium]|jgi:NitT/TauT family transport system permease protein|nr:ABC transporter permease [Clostridiales Family XIII bacterium]
MEENNGKLRNKIISIVAIVFFFVAWFIAGELELYDTQFVPGLGTVFAEAWHLIQNGVLLECISISVFRIVVGLSFSIVVGIPLGYLLGGFSPKFAAFIKPLLKNLSLVNCFTLIPVFILLFGIGEGSKMGIIFWVLVFPVMFATIQGVEQIDPAIINAARSMGAGKIKIFFDIALPAAATPVFAGVKSAASLGFLVLLSAETVGAKSGLGWLVFNSHANYNVPRLFVGILAVALFGFVFTAVIELAQKRIIVWKEES